MRGYRFFLLGFALLGCHAQEDVDRDARPKWIHEQTVDGGWPLREVLNGTGDIMYFDGWYNLEFDPKSGGAWRWMDKRGVLRLRTKPSGATEPRDMELHVFGWVPWQDVGFRTNHLDFMVNGHVLDHFEPPKTSFEHVLIVPRALLENADWVDFVITAANTSRPRGDWRDLGFATTGFWWKPVGT